MTDHEGVRPDTEHDAGEETQAPASDAAALAVVPTGDEPVDDFPHRVGCRSELRGWAGAHLHGAVRPRRRAAGRGRPPGRWC
ncbi:hypothetical protein AB0J80_09015 [Actinoplanes sp. NPDC049548]|uniref:hypothetical protein n=1 Tax=Actinoplanes sp. NPDC049548 TaxID=3155152 RepID=UPI00344822D0